MFVASLARSIAAERHDERLKEAVQRGVAYTMRSTSSELSKTKTSIILETLLTYVFYSAASPRVVLRKTHYAFWFK